MTTSQRNVRIYKPADPMGRRLERLLSLEVREAVLKTEISAEKGYILKHATRYGVDVLKLEGDRLTVSRAAGKTSWVYSDEVNQLAARLKELQQAERLNGTAKEVAGGPYLSVRVGKGAAAAPPASQFDLDGFRLEIDKAADTAGGEADAAREAARERITA